MPNKPMVSVIMATFNEPKAFIEASIASILNQTFSDLELLIADDSTNPETVKVIDDFAASDSRVVVIRKAERMGFVNALNEALNLAKGDLIARMDGDDMALPKRFEIQLRYAAGHPGVDVFGGDMDIIDEQDVVQSERRYPTTPAAIQRKFIFRSPFAHPTIMFRRRIIDAGIRYNPEYKKFNAKHLLIWKLIVYRVHQAHNISSTSIIHSITKTDIIIAKINTVRIVNITMSG